MSIAEQRPGALTAQEFPDSSNAIPMGQTWTQCGWEQGPSRRLREILVAGLLVTAAMAPFLLLSRPDRDSAAASCVEVIEIWGPVHLILNCDSGAFVRLAENPGLMLTPQHRLRQNRPLYSSLGWVLSWPFHALGFEALGLRMLGGRIIPKIGQPYGKYLPEYTGFLLLHWLLLLASVVLFWQLLAAGSLLEPRLLLPLAVLLVNEVTKAYFWTPHVQIFNVFIPVMSLSLFRWIQPRLPMLTWPSMAVIGLLLGLGSLAYGAFAVTAGGAALCVLMGEGFSTLRKRFAVKILHSLILLASFFVPLAVWSTFVIARTGYFYSHEVVVFRQFVWLSDSWSREVHVLYANLSQNLAAYLSTITTAAAFPALTLTALTVMAYALGLARQPSSHDRDTGRAILWYVLANVPFYALMGYYETRLSWTIVPALLLVLGIEIGRIELALSDKARSAVRAGIVVLTICYVAYWMVKEGPYS